MECYHIENQISQELFSEVYKLLSEALPADEIRTWNGQKSLLAIEAYHIYLHKDDKEEIKAVLAVWELEEFIFVEHFAVHSDQRGKGVGSKLFQEFLNQTSKKVVLEVELPETETAKRRIGFYERLGLVCNWYPYEQLPLNKGDKPLPLCIMSYPESFNEEQFQTVKTQIYQKVYQNPAVIFE